MDLAKKAGKAKTQHDKDDIMDLVYKIKEDGEFQTLQEAFNDQFEI